MLGLSSQGTTKLRVIGNAAEAMTYALGGNHSVSSVLNFYQTTHHSSACASRKLPKRPALIFMNLPVVHIAFRPMEIRYLCHEWRKRFNCSFEDNILLNACGSILAIFNTSSFVQILFFLVRILAFCLKKRLVRG